MQGIFNAPLKPKDIRPFLACKLQVFRTKQFQKATQMNISGAITLPNLLTTGVDSVATRNLEEAAKARRAFEVLQREQEKVNRANSAGLQGNGSKTAQTLFETQDFAAKFKEFMDKTPDEMLREQILKELGVTEEELESLPPEERALMEEKIRDRFEQKIEESMREKGIEVEIGSVAVSSAAVSSV